MPRFRIITNKEVTKVYTYVIEAQSKQDAISEWQNGADWVDENETDGIEHFGRIEEMEDDEET